MILETLIHYVTYIDRKPVDPPPIVQLHIIDPEDPAQYVENKQLY